MEDKLVQLGFIPLDKSWIIRMGILDLVNNRKDTICYLNQNYDKLGDDLKILYKALTEWDTQKQITVGESGTLYRFLKFASWKLNKNKEFILKGTLNYREICDNQKIINWSINKLLKLDNGTSQWASASVLLGNNEKISNPPYKLQVTYDAVKHWKAAREKKEIWKPRYDRTILRQAIAYLGFLKSGKIIFIPEQAEDYCFARAFGLITSKEGERRWPSLRGHESDRIKEMEIALNQKEVTSKDHRVVQAIAMLKGNSIKVKHKESVNKSWPQFWSFLDYANNKL